MELYLVSWAVSPEHDQAVGEINPINFYAIAPGLTAAMDIARNLQERCPNYKVFVTEVL